MRFRLRSLLLIFAVAAAILSAAVPFVRWLNSRPGVEITDSHDWPIEIREITRSLGEGELKDMRVWHLHGGWFDFNFVWRAKASPEAVKTLRQFARMNQILVAQIPPQYWAMPPDWSEMPSWWNPKPVAGAEYYMSPTFVPRNVHSDRLDCVAMYDPDQQLLYVWSQWDF